MKRLVALFLSLLIVFTLTACGSENSNNADKGELYSKAITVLDELGEDQRVKDFCTAYELLMSLPDDEDKFISQLEEVYDIFSKYDVELDSGDYYLTPNITPTEENIEKYKSKGAFYDANDLLDCIVYPVLFEKYGSDAKCIKGLTAKTVIDAIKSTGDYTFDDKTEQYDLCKERWEYVGVPKSRYVVNYHGNGLVESLTVPIVRSDVPLNDADYEAFYDNEAATQKRILGDRIIDMSNQFNTIFTGYEVLCQIFSDEEITIISNYIHSLTLDEIWARDLISSLAEPENYFSALVVFNYKGYQIGISYSLNDISLQISGSNGVNSLTHRWYTLWCGLCLPEGSEETVENYSDYINNNTAANEIIYDYSFDLDANADKYKGTSTITNQQPQNDDNSTKIDVQQSIPVEMSMSDTITAYGIIEKNDTAFPTYRLRLSPKLTIIFDEYIGEKVFECEYLYFYDDAELNNYYSLWDFVGENCKITAQLEDYRGGEDLFILKPTITIN